VKNATLPSAPTSPLLSTSEFIHKISHAASHIWGQWNFCDGKEELCRQVLSSPAWQRAC